MNDTLEKELVRCIKNYEIPQRITFSKKYPILKKPVVFLHCLLKSIQNFLDHGVKYERKKDFYQYVMASHQAVLRRTYGNSDPALQENKIINLKQALEKLNGIVIKPNKTFSFWNAIGRPSKKNGYVNGRFFLNGKVTEEVGGGLCQLSSFLYWMFLHTPITVLERHNHSIDDFPESGKNLAFRCGATVLYNSVDLKVRNDYKYPIQLKMWITENDLNGQIVSLCALPEKIHIAEKNHCFVKRGNKIYQYSEVYREEYVNDQLVKTEKTSANFTQVLYNITDEYIKDNNFKLYDFSNM